MRVCVIGSFMMDLVVTAARRPNPGETMFGDTFTMCVGGKGFNQAVAASRAGSEVAMIGRLGKDPFAQTISDFMKAENINSDGVEYDEEVGTGTALPLVEHNGQNSIVIVPQANLKVDSEQIDRHRDVIAGSDVVVLQFEIPMETVKYVAKISKEMGKTVILNPAPYADLDKDLLESIDFIIPNETELKGIIPDCEIENVDGIVEKVKEFQQQFPINFVVTLGERGVVAVTKDSEVINVSPNKVTPIDTVGAGDTFCGYFASAFANGKSLKECLELANKAASISVTRRGAAQSVPMADEL